MKKYLVGGLAAVAMAAPAVALAQQTPDPIVTASGKLSSSNAGTKAKPTGVKFTFKAQNSAPSQTTVSRIVLDMPTGVQLSGKNLDACPLSTLSRGPRGCKSTSKVGTGVAHAFVVNKARPAPECVATNGAAPGCLRFETQFFVGGPRLLSVWLQQTNGNVQKAFQGRISSNGRSLSIEIPKDLQSPAAGVYSALLELSGSFQRTKTVRGKKYSFVSTTGCTARKWAFRTTFHYVGNPQAPSVSSRSAENSQTCSK